MSDWWSRQLSGEKPSYPVTTPPITPPMRTAIRIPQSYSPYPQSMASDPQSRSLDPMRSPDEQITMGDALRLWRGGEAARKETHSCPECGSSLVFSRSKGGVNGMPPAPRCYTCGWNGKYSQGDQSSWI